MINLDTRLMQGTPLHYIVPYQPLQHPLEDNRFSYFNRFDRFRSDSGDMGDELIMPNSPTSSQSDSENSVSSIEISPKQIRPHPSKLTEVECRWRNCGLIFETLDLLASHVTKVHASSGPGGLFYCGWDGCTRNNRGFNARYKMLVHVRTHTNEKPHRCDQCDKSFSRAENLKIHTRSHSGEKPYVCPVPGCLKAYSNSSDRFKHTRTHQIDKPYQCKVPGCPKRYTDPSSLRKHVKTFKHFINTDARGEEFASENVPKTIDALSQNRDVAISTEKYYRTQEIQILPEDKRNVSCPCSCPHSCCPLKATELLKFTGLANLRNDDIRHVQWNRLFLQEQKNYANCNDINKTDVENMDVDVPLDLTVTKKPIIYND